MVNKPLIRPIFFCGAGGTTLRGGWLTSLNDRSPPKTGRTASMTKRIVVSGAAKVKKAKGCKDNGLGEGATV